MDSYDSIKITDFGFACTFNEEGLTLKLGSPIFMAPELFKKEVYNDRVDIWSIGIITYMMIFGEPPFMGQDAN